MPAKAPRGDLTNSYLRGLGAFTLGLFIIYGLYDALINLSVSGGDIKTREQRLHVSNGWINN